MPGEKEKQLIESDAYQSYIKWRNGFVLRLAVFHFILVFLFDTLSIFTPSIMIANVWKGSAFTVGFIFACGIVISVILSSVYYSHRINQREIIFNDGSKQLNGKS